MLKYIAKKAALTVGMILIVSFIIFVALNSTGVDPVLYTMDMTTYNAQMAQQIRESLGLDAPLMIRYFHWWNDMLHGNFGYSIAKKFSIRDGLISKWPASLELSVSAFVLSTVFGILLGMLTAFYQNGILDYVGRAFAVFGNSMPEYFFALILIQIFSVQLGWLPSGGRFPVGAAGFLNRLPNMILPITAMTVPMCGNLMRYTRNTMLDVANQEYVKTARSKGLPEWKVYTKHIFRNSLRPIVTVLLFRLTLLIGGSVAIETIFSWPGVGPVLTASVTACDYPVVMVSTLMTAVLMLVISFLIDLSTALLDPRVRLEV